MLHEDTKFAKTSSFLLTETIIYSSLLYEKFVSILIYYLDKMSSKRKCNVRAFKRRENIKQDFPIRGGSRANLKEGQW